MVSWSMNGFRLAYLLVLLLRSTFMNSAILLAS